MGQVYARRAGIRAAAQRLQLRVLVWLVRPLETLTLGWAARAIVVLVTLVGLNQTAAVFARSTPNEISDAWGPVFLISGLLGVYIVFVRSVKVLTLLSITGTYLACLGRGLNLWIEAAANPPTVDWSGGWVGDTRAVLALIGGRGWGGGGVYLALAILVAWTGKRIAES